MSLRVVCLQLKCKLQWCGSAVQTIFPENCKLHFLTSLKHKTDLCSYILLTTKQLPG